MTTVIFLTPHFYSHCLENPSALLCCYLPSLLWKIDPCLTFPASQCLSSYSARSLSGGSWWAIFCCYWLFVSVFLNPSSPLFFLIKASGVSFEGQHLPLHSQLQPAVALWRSLWKVNDSRALSCLVPRGLGSLHGQSAWEALSSEVVLCLQQGERRSGLAFCLALVSVN